MASSFLKAATGQLTPWQTALAVVITMVLGALGSGIWIWIFEPVVLWSARAALSLLTLGSNALSDAVYIRISKGWSNGIDIVLFSLLPAAVAGYSLFLTIRRRWSVGAPPRPSFQARPQHRRFRAGLLGALWLEAGLLIGITAYFSYTNTARVHFHQSFAIVAPYLDEKQEELITSRFAQVKGRGDYVALIQELEHVARENDLTLPDFVVW